MGRFGGERVGAGNGRGEAARVGLTGCGGAVMAGPERGLLG